MKTVLVLVAMAAVATAFDKTAEWENWKKLHNKQYPSLPEEMYRRTIWLSNSKFIEEHNARDNGFTVAMNKFGDLDSREFAEIYNGYSHKGDGKGRRGDPFVPSVSVGSLPDTVDWRTKGYVTPIKNQGQCGSCWAFSATGSMEGQHFNATGNLVSLSEQNLVDCSGAEGNDGCDGGLPDYAFEYVIKNGGIDTESSYPYVARDETCRFNAANIGSTCKGYVDITKDSEADLQVAVATVGPVSVGIDASHLSFQFYHGGVYHSFLCSQTNLDHGVLVVGYGVYNGDDYWLVKNSWGTDWGLKGYIMMSRNRDNNCGIASEASYPIVTS